MKYTDRTSLQNKTVAHQTTKEYCTIIPSMARKIAPAGLGYCHLDFVYTRDGPDGLIALLKEDFNGKLRVSKDKRIHRSLISHFADKQGQIFREWLK